MKLRGLLTVALVAAIGASGAQARVDAHNPGQLSDPAGDGNGAADITGVIVGNTLAGDVFFLVQVNNRSGIVANDAVLVRIDADRNAATGDRDGDGGIDYILLINGTAQQVVLLRWNGTQFDSSAPASLEADWANGYFVAVNRSELGNTTAFDYDVFTALIEGADNQFDVAPNDVFGEYTLSAPHIESATARFAPTAPRAGRPFRVSGVQLKLETEETAAATSYSCRATLAGRRLAGRGAGGCTFRLPASARGKRLVVTVTATLAGGGGSVTLRPVAFKVR